jgi:hypothetical protein
MDLENNNALVCDKCKFVVIYYCYDNKTDQFIKQCLCLCKCMD